VEAILLVSLNIRTPRFSYLIFLYVYILNSRRNHRLRSSSFFDFSYLCLFSIHLPDSIVLLNAAYVKPRLIKNKAISIL